MRSFFRRFNRIYITALSVTMMIGLIVATRMGERASAVGKNSSSAIGPVVSVNAASYQRSLSPGMITAAFGVDLATQEGYAQTQPLPTELAGTTVRLVDSRGVEFRAPLFFVSQKQINYFIPEEVALGTAQLTVTNGNGVISQETVQINNSSPGIFTTTFNGVGLPVALTTLDGANFESIANPDGTAKPVAPGTPWRPNYMTLFATGIRKGTEMKVTVGGVEVTPMYFGPQNTYVGLDQINVPLPSTLSDGMVSLSVASGGQTSNNTQFQQGPMQSTSPRALSVTDVQTIISQGVTRAQQLGKLVTIAVTDQEGNVLGVFKMTGARSDILIGATNLENGARTKQPDPQGFGLEGVTLPLPGAPPPFNDGAALAAISKAGTSSFFSTQGSALTTRSASYIIQEHFPALFTNTVGGPLFGVQFSQLPCSDVKIPNLPLGLSGDPGSAPIYKNGMAAGGVGVEGDGLYSVDLDPSDQDRKFEEDIALAATTGFTSPPAISIANALVDGKRLPLFNQQIVPTQGAPFATLPGTVLATFPIRATQPSRFMPQTIAGVAGRVDPRFFPFRASTVPGPNQLTIQDVTTIIGQAARGSRQTRAAIRLPVVPAEVNITVVDTTGAILGIFSTSDAPIFGFDVSAQKARSTAFLSSPMAAAMLNAAEGGKFSQFVSAAAADGIRLDGSIIFSDRAIGFLSRPFLPDGQDNSMNGPFSRPIAKWSPFNVGLQIALDQSALVSILSGTPRIGCTAIPNLNNGLQIFAGSVGLYKNGQFVGAIGISGDGIDQDEIIASFGAIGFEVSPNMRSDAFTVRNVRMPYVKFPPKPLL